MAFENDVMISYAWRDNQPPPMTTGEGWVSGLQEGLEYWLKQLMPRNPRIWRDEKRMPGNKVFAEELDEVVQKTAVLLTVMSEPYLASEWCNRERVNFIKSAIEQGGMEVNNDYRIFKINKLPVDRKSLPKELNVITGFDFYVMDSDTRNASPIDPTFGDKEKREFLKKVYDVAVDLARLLKALEKEEIRPIALRDTKNDEKGAEVKEAQKTAETKPNAGAKQQGPVVFLPYTTRDLAAVRDELISELRRRNCTIVPDEPFPYEDIETFKAAALENIEKADIAIHLIGARYGMILEGSTKSVIELQNTWASDESEKRGLRRLIWMPKTQKEMSGQQFTFVDCLRTDRMALRGADFLEDSMENMKSIALEMLAPPQKAAPVDEVGGELKVYLMCTEGDRDEIRGMRKLLRGKSYQGQKLKLLLPVYDGEPAELHKIQQQRLQECDAVMVYWGSANEAWLFRTLNEVRKAPGFGRDRPFKTKHLVVLSQEKTSSKEDYWLDYVDEIGDEDVQVVEAYDPISEEFIDQYIQSIS